MPVARISSDAFNRQLPADLIFGFCVFAPFFVMVLTCVHAPLKRWEAKNVNNDHKPPDDIATDIGRHSQVYCVQDIHHNTIQAKTLCISEHYGDCQAVTAKVVHLRLMGPQRMPPVRP